LKTNLDKIMERKKPPVSTTPLKEVTIKIAADDQSHLIDYYENKRVALLKHLAEIQTAIIQVNETIKNLGGGSDDADISQLGLGLNYNPDWGWPDKIIFSLNRLGVVSTAKQIFDGLVDIDKNLRPLAESELNKQYQNLAAAISYQSNLLSSKIMRYKKVDDGPFLIGLKEWFDEGGLPKEQFKRKLKGFVIKSDRDAIMGTNVIGTH
jgi:hypothetical protein